MFESIWLNINGLSFRVLRMSTVYTYYVNQFFLNFSNLYKIYGSWDHYFLYMDRVCLRIILSMLHYIFKLYSIFDVDLMLVVFNLRHEFALAAIYPDRNAIHNVKCNVIHVNLFVYIMADYDNLILILR